jgi:hypothetical protein
LAGIDMTEFGQPVRDPELLKQKLIDIMRDVDKNIVETQKKK